MFFLRYVFAWCIVFTVFKSYGGLMPSESYAKYNGAKNAKEKLKFVDGFILKQFQLTIGKIGEKGFFGFMSKKRLKSFTPVEKRSLRS